LKPGRQWGWIDLKVSVLAKSAGVLDLVYRKIQAESDAESNIAFHHGRACSTTDVVRRQVRQQNKE
jgi:hypothetical protein